MASMITDPGSPVPGDVVHWPSVPQLRDSVRTCHGGSNALDLWMVETSERGWALVRRSERGWTVDEEQTAPISRVQGPPGIPS